MRREMEVVRGWLVTMTHDKGWQWVRKNAFRAFTPSSRLENWWEEGNMCCKIDRVEADMIPYFFTVLILLSLFGVKVTSKYIFWHFDNLYPGFYVSCKALKLIRNHYFDCQCWSWSTICKTKKLNTAELILRASRIFDRPVSSAPEFNFELYSLFQQWKGFFSSEYS